IAEAREFPLVDKVRLLARLARAVQRLHDSNLIHGDLSPNNILVQKGDRIRLIDMGQGGRLAKGYQSLRSVSGRAGTEGFSPAALLARKEKPGRPSDIRQLVAVAYHTFTGHSAGSDTEEAGKARRTAELDQAGLPPALVRSLLKGLRDRNSRLEDNAPDPRLYATAGEFADDLDLWCAARENRQKRWRVALLVTLFVAPALGLAGYFWNQSEVARQAYESRQVEELVDQSDRLANASHPAVKSLLDASLEEKRAEDHARRTGDPSEAKRHLVARRELLRRAIRTSEELLRCQPLREHLTTVLTKSPWTMSAPKIARSVEALRTMSEEIRLLLEQGQTDEALEKLARFHRQLAETADENTAARAAADSRDGYERLKKQIPERLQLHAGLAPITADFARAEQTWTAGEWDAATLSFGQLQQTLDGWLKENANAEEFAALQQASVESIERLEREKGEFRTEIAQQKTRIGELQTQITDLTADALKKQQRLEAKLLAEETKRKSTEGERDAAKMKVTNLEGDLKVSRQNEVTLTQKKTELEKQLTAETNQRTTAERERDLARTENGKLTEQLTSTSTERDEAKSKLNTQKQLVAAADDDVEKWKKHAEASAKLLKELQAAKIPTPPGPRQRVDTVKASTRIAEAKEAGERLVLNLNGVEFAFRWCPKTSEPFKMGSPKNEVGRDDNNENQVDVTLSHGFWMLETEVTQKMWIAVMGTAKAAKWTKEYGKGDNYPAYYIDWTEAKKFGATLTEQMRKAGVVPSGWMLDLPSEAQWENACRAGGKGRFCFGDYEKLLEEYAWFGGKGGHPYHSVGTKRANAWGLFDLHGSVWEWTDSWYDTTLKAGTDPRGPTVGSYRVNRGGSAWGDAANSRSSFRGRYDPSGSNHDLGFRLLAVPVR
ncbi:MAG: SUMF1/EgtB/PvdO family nonheme iron enzyme, partial [Planctomycetota bacterium]|nr:SUMF1/EgtB/PvdO family nonheme iron enzyme [Planctomycetota bacterium]